MAGSTVSRCSGTWGSWGAEGGETGGGGGYSKHVDEFNQRWVSDALSALVVGGADSAD